MRGFPLEAIKFLLLKMFLMMITTQAQCLTTKAQSMKAQDNREVVPQGNKHVSNVASRLRDITRMNPPTFCVSKVEEDPHEFID